MHGRPDFSLGWRWILRSGREESHPRRAVLGYNAAVSVVIAKAYHTHGPAVFRRARRLVGTEARASQIAREVFSSLVDRPAEFSGAASPMTLIYRETTNRCLEQIRRTKTPRPPKGVADDSPEARRAAQQATLCDLLRPLPDDEALVLVYYYVDELSQEEISDVLGRSSRNVGELLELDEAGKRTRGTAPAAGLKRTRPDGCLSDLELDRVLVGEVDDELIALGHEHMDECKLCTARWNEIVAAADDLPSLDVRPKHRAAWIVAAVVLLAAAALFALTRS